MQAEPGRPEPSRRLPPEARGMFLVQALGVAAPVAIVGLLAGGWLESAGAPDWLGTVVRIAAVAGAVIGVAVFPLLRWRSWRYEVRDEELDLLRGAVVRTRTLIPMARVQHVDTRRTAISDLFELRSVSVHTAAGSHTIPALAPDEAIAIRDRIAELAREPDGL